MGLAEDLKARSAHNDYRFPQSLFDRVYHLWKDMGLTGPGWAIL